ncbi:iron-containing alcohol dehydrogenase (plasmid) [Rhizorhabdus wittichii RW1]|jgi:alcohol dehydrogenase class IV|uniref:Iron-containing alcohol dehydrogenase n=1 Tax=Rhizorhabdus wittichii (strain DSM 6014 / CCUG 31198 / JCM 15750 / NBRC 105917 / EY 4224 / RW1) TaxID=392499 RepID=A0A9J9LH05_RHIWR|nr:maleylacetate reductase [Sphingobium sp. LB126]ABQ71675.1 iron-containing alcohol dehydrogenase [Rhizorhabdus wittichii RW1]PJG45551.1 maleylacetate reductase [Sphingobium sp. LB126]
MIGFVHTALPGRVIFGHDTLPRVAEEAERSGFKRALVLTTPQQVDQGKAVLDLLGERGCTLFDGATMHTPVEVTERALSLLADHGADGLVSIGGGSTIGLGKALALRTGLDQIVIPTTYAGSEMTSILGETRDGKKTTLRSPDVLPETVIYDVSLTYGLPTAMSVTSGINAIAHAAEALYSAEVSPIIAMMAQEGIRTLVEALPSIAANPRDAAARDLALRGSWLCGTCLGSVDMALHHKLAHVLGGIFDLPHAELHTVLLPHALAYNLPAAPKATEQLRAVLGQDPATILRDLAVRLGAPSSLAALGMPRDGVDHATVAALQARYPNPRTLEEQGIRGLLERAWAGDAPRA